MPRLFLLLISSILFSLSSCVSHEELINFRTGKEKIPTLSQLPKQDIIGQADLKLQVNDVLAVIISSPDGVLATPYNLVPAQLAIQVVSPTSPSTFLISTDGTVNLPSLGVMKAAGLSLKELREDILKKVSVYLENPSVNVRLLNFKVTVLGEVDNPGSFQVENERITLLEALGRAGDLTDYSNRKHIMVVREHNGVREYGEVDLKDTKFFTSPYYYLQQNDIIYVEPTRAKRDQLRQSTSAYVQPIGLALSLITTLVLLFRK